MQCLPKVMAYLALMLNYFLCTYLAIYIFKKVLSFHDVTAYIEKSCNVLILINDFFSNLPFAVLPVLRSGDVETKPGPKKSLVIKLYHWNLNELAAHGFLKVSLTEAFITTYKFDIIVSWIPFQILQYLNMMKI